VGGGLGDLGGGGSSPKRLVNILQSSLKLGYLDDACIAYLSLVIYFMVCGMTEEYSQVTSHRELSQSFRLLYSLSQQVYIRPVKRFNDQF
jgi:hypothetical protein